MKLNKAIKVIEDACENPQVGVPEEVFMLLTRLTPIINVDLLIKDNDERTLLTWRDDVFYGKGWHIPGGIIRFKESAAERIKMVAKLELECEVTNDNTLLEINESITKNQTNRAHFFSLLYRCELQTDPPEKLKYISGIPERGMYSFFDGAPENLLQVHLPYGKYL